MAIKKWIAVNDGGTVKILTDDNPAKTAVYEIELLEPEDTAQVATLGAWADLVDNVVNKGIKNVFYKIEDMAGVEGFADNEPALVHVDGTGNAFIQKEQIYSKAPDALKLNELQPRSYTPQTTPGASPTLAFGDINDAAQRALFMSNAVEHQEYSFRVGTLVHRGTVLTKVGDGTNPTDELIIEGNRINTSTLETFKLKVVPTGVEDEVYIPIKAAGFEFDAEGTPADYGDGEAMPKSTIQQVIDNSIALLPTPLTGNYNSQVDNLKVITSLSDLTPGLKREYTFPNGITTANVGGCEIAMNYSNGGETGTTKQGFDLRGWDTSKPLYLSITYHGGATYIWVELKMEAVAGDNTKYSLTNYKSGAAGSEMNAFGVASIQFKGGQ